MNPPLSIRLADESAERVRQSVAKSIVELQGVPAASAVIINDQPLPDSTIVLVAHKLGRRPRITLVSPPRDASTAGAILELTDAASNPDRTLYVALKAIGWGATITVDVEVK